MGEQRGDDHAHAADHHGLFHRLSLSSHVVIWMPFVMSDVHNAQAIRVHFIKYVVGKSAQVRAAKAMARKMKSKRIVGGL